MREKITSRRSLLKAASISAVSIAGIGSAAGSTKKGQETEPFNPNNLKQAHNFHEENLRLTGPKAVSREESEETLERLSKSQIRALVEITQPDTLRQQEHSSSSKNNTGVGKNQIDTDGITTQSDYPYVEKYLEHSIWQEGVTGAKVWTLEYDVHFEYNGHDDVANIVDYVKAYTDSALWFKRSSDSDISDFGGSFKALGEATFEQCFTQLGCVNSADAWIEYTANYSGSYQIDSN